MAHHKVKKYPDNLILKKLREDMGLSTRALADKLGINRTSVWELEKGYTRLNQETLQIYSDFFNVSYDYLLGKQEQALIEKGFSTEQVQLLLSNDKVIRDLQVKAYVVLSEIIKIDDIKVVIAVMMDLLKEDTERDYNKEIREKYERLSKEIDKELLETKKTNNEEE